MKKFRTSARRNGKRIKDGHLAAIGMAYLYIGRTQHRPSCVGRYIALQHQCILKHPR